MSGEHSGFVFLTLKSDRLREKQEIRFFEVY